MVARRQWMMLLAAVWLTLLAGCGGFGKVNQGRVVAYDANQGLMTLILDSNYQEPGKPKYDALPPVTVRIPQDPQAMGPAPQAGGLLELNLKAGRILSFDAASQSLAALPLRLVAKREGVSRDDRLVAGVRFPVVDRAGKTVTIYLPKPRQLITFSVPDEYLALPDSAWVVGDEVRYYYKDPGQALRLMNVTKTEIT
jgi:hypothetical protein